MDSVCGDFAYTPLDHLIHIDFLVAAIVRLQMMFSNFESGIIQLSSISTTFSPRVTFGFNLSIWRMFQWRKEWRGGLDSD